MLEILHAPTSYEFYDSVLNYKPPQPLIILNCCLIIVSFFITMYGIRLISYSESYHYNTKRLFLLELLSWLTLPFSKIFRFLYEYNLTSIDSVKDVELIYSSSGLFFLRTAAFFRYFYIFYATTAPFGATIERAFATHFVTDYELSERAWICVGIATSKFIFAAIFGGACAFMELQLIVAVLLIGTAITMCITLNIFLYYYNKKQIHMLDHFHRKSTYTLSKRFQLRENIQILTLLIRIFAMYIIFIVWLAFIIIAPITTDLSPSVSASMHVLSDFCLHCSPLIVISIAILVIPEWTVQCRKETNELLGLRKTGARVQVVTLPPSEADTYFDLFKKSIEGPPEVVVKGSGSKRKKKSQIGNVS